MFIVQIQADATPRTGKRFLTEDPTMLGHIMAGFPFSIYSARGDYKGVGYVMKNAFYVQMNYAEDRDDGKLDYIERATNGDIKKQHDQRDNDRKEKAS